jgi:hypothetical protein
MTDTYSKFPSGSPHGPRPLTSSWPIPKRGQKDVLVKDEIHKDTIAAAGLTFYGMFAVFRAITAFVTPYGLITRCAAGIGRSAR